MRMTPLVLAAALGLAAAPGARGADSHRCRQGPRSRGGCRARPFAPAWTLAREIPDTGLVPGRQVRDLHPLGSLLGARLRQRVVSAQHVQERREGLRAPRQDLRAPVPLRLQGLHPALQGREIRRGGLGRALQGGRREVRRAGCRAPRRLPDVRQRLHRVERRPHGAQARCGGRAGQQRSAPRA